jgi:hypothetical protein
MDNIEKNIIEWLDKFNKYIETEANCIINIESIIEVRTNIDKMIHNQRKDDIQFYKSILDNSLYYLNNSLKIKKIKFTKDLNYIWNKIDERKKMDDITKTNFEYLLKDYKKVSEEIAEMKKNNNKLAWIKDETIHDLQEVEHDINGILDYHLKLIEFFHSSIEIEKVFYCGK